MIYLRTYLLAALAAGLALALGRPASAQSVYTYPYSTGTVAGVLRTPGSATGTPGQFELPFGVAVDSVGNIYVGDTDNDQIRVVTPGGNVTVLAGLATVAGTADGTGSSARFNHPEGVAVDSSGNVYVADISNNTIRMVTPAGVVTALAGTAGLSGSTDATGAAARFSGPSSVAVDAADNVYVADTYNDTIRKITPAGVVTTLAGTAGVTGSTDATGAAARFNQPAGVAVDAAGDVYVADTNNNTIRKVTPAGVVTTLAGTAGVSGSTDATGAAARFYLPIGLAVDKGGNVYVADTYNDTIRIMTPAGSVSTVAGVAGTTGTTDGVGSSALFYRPYSVAVDSTGQIYIADTDNIVLRRALSGTLPTINTQPQGSTITAGGTTSLSVTATGALTYQWYLNGATVAGATSSSLTLTDAGTDEAGSYTVAVSNASGTVTSSSAVVAVNYSARLTNLAARGYAGSGGGILIAGFNTSGSGSKNLLLRGDGPLLASQVSGALTGTSLALYDSSSTLITTDTGWGNALVAGTSSESVSPQLATATFMNSVGAQAFAAGSADSAMEISAPVSGFTAEVAGLGGSSGVGEAEIYDADSLSATARLSNLAARAYVGTGADVLIGGFAIGGSTPETVLLRADGPALAAAPFNISGTLGEPVMTLYDNNGKVIATNTGWGNASIAGNSTVQAGIRPATVEVMNEVGAFSLPAGSADCAMVATLPTGNYTVIVSGVGGTTGVALVEIYEVP